MSDVVFSGSSLRYGKLEITLPHPVSDAFEDHGVIVVLFDPDEIAGTENRFKNLWAYSASGKKLWEAELPTKRGADVFYRITNKAPLLVNSFSSHECEIDLKTGELLRADFYK